MSAPEQVAPVRVEKPARDIIPIHFACNDPDSGDFTGHVCQISLPDEALSLTSKNWNITSTRGCPKLRTTDGAIFMSGKRWPFIRCRAWVGNWCWDSYTMTAPGATAFLTWLHRRGRFQCEGGWVDLAEAWDKPAPLSLPDRWWVA